VHQKLDEFLRRGTPEDLMAANELMKLMAGYVRARPLRKLPSL